MDRNGQSDGGSPGEVLRLIRDGRAVTRSDLVEMTGLGRSTVGASVDALLASGLVREKGEVATGGRPRARLTFNAHSGVVLAADLGATHCRLEVTEMSGAPLVSVAEDLAIADGPELVLEHVERRLAELLDEAGHSGADVRGIGIGVPGPVEFSLGTPVSPPIMPGWDGVAIPERFARRWPVPVLVDNDVNIMALGEHRTRWRGTRHMLFVKVGTGIGCGIIADGEIHRGGQGAAGDVGHIRVSGYEDRICVCGNVACLEAVAGGGALAARLRELEVDAPNSRAVVDLVRAGNAVALRMVREAGRVLGEVLASLVNFFNPEVVVVGGDVAEAHEQLLAGMREIVYQRSLPLATRHLRITHSALADRAGATGAALLAIEHALSDAAVAAAVSEARGLT